MYEKAMYDVQYMSGSTFIRQSGGGCVAALKEIALSSTLLGCASTTTLSIVWYEEERRELFLQTTLRDGPCLHTSSYQK